jgi:transposase
MIPQGVEVFVSLDPVNLRLSFDRLAGLVDERMGRCARSEALFVFFNRRRTMMKALFFDGTGLCIFHKRLDKGRFQLPDPIEDGNGERVVELNERELDDLLDGLELHCDREAPKPNPLLH